MAAHRRALLIFVALFVVLFAIVAMAEGIGDPSIPSGDVALVEDTPGDLGKVSQADFDRAFEQAAAQQGIKKTPKPGDPQYEEVKNAAMFSIFDSIWLQGLADEMGIEVGDKEIDDEREKLKDENFQTPKEFQDFLKESKYTMADIDERVKLQILSTQIQEQISEEAPEPTQGEVEDYYEAAKASQFAQPETRDYRQVVNKDRKKAEQALQALEGDNTEKNWKKVVNKYSEAPGGEPGGLVQGATEGLGEKQLDEAVFSATEGQLEGPIKTQQGYHVFEVTKINPASVQPLKAVEKQIEETLAQRAEQEYFSGFVTDFNTSWRSRTFCASDYTMERCANFKGGSRPSTAPPACYEEDPKGGRPEACPAPVQQLIPAMPGSVTVLEPKGNPLAQRPHPAGEEKAGGEEETLELPGGATPPTEAPPSE